MQNIVIILGLAILGGFLLFGAFNSSAGFKNLVIEEIRFKEPTQGPDIDEWVVVANRTGQNVDLTGWKLESADGASSPPSIGQSFVFPSGCILPPNGKVYIHSGPITNSFRNQPVACGSLRIDLYPLWNAPDGAPTGWWDGTPEAVGNTIWGNEGDTAWLLQPRTNRAPGDFFVFDRVDTCTYSGNEANGVKKCR